MAPADALPATLLAVDMGLSTGLALYGRDGRLQWYRSRHFANHTALRKAVRRLISETHPAYLYLEGGGTIANVWLAEAARRDITAVQVAAETWRADLLLDRDQRSGRQAKDRAGTLARRVIAHLHFGERRPGRRFYSIRYILF